MKSSKLISAVIAVCAVSACARFDHLGRPPSMSPVTAPRHAIDPNAVTPRQPLPHLTPGIGRTTTTQNPLDMGPLHTASIRAPRVELERGSTVASLWSHGPRSLFGDRRARQVGDILTVVVEIEDEAEISNATNRSRSGSDDVSVSALYGLERVADAILPGSGALNPGVAATGTSNSSGQGSVKRDETIKLRVAATVIDVLPNGHMLVTGNQEVRVNFELRDLQVVGVIRPEDITRQNTITYDKMANARISYGGRGHISDVQQARYGQQVLEIVSPF